MASNPNIANQILANPVAGKLAGSVGLDINTIANDPNNQTAYADALAGLNGGGGINVTAQPTGSIHGRIAANVGGSSGDNVQKSVQTVVTTPQTGGDTNKTTYTRKQASQLFTGLLTTYGFNRAQIGTLLPQVQKWMNDGLTTEAITANLPSTEAYQQRFPANKELIKQGLGAYSPAEYISLEKQYASIGKQYGLPAKFYDQPSDFTKWIAGNVSPAEVSQRVADAADIVNKAPKDTLKALGEYYGLSKGDLYAYVLDEHRSVDLIEKQLGAAKIGAQGIQQGLSVSRHEAQYLYGQGTTTQQAAQAFGQTIQQQGQLAKLAGLAGIRPLKQDSITNSILGFSAKGSQKITNILNQEAAKFGGSNAGQGLFAAGSNAGSVA